MAGNCCADRKKVNRELKNLINRIISRYHVIVELSLSGMDQVYKAEDTRSGAIWDLNFYRAILPAVPGAVNEKEI